MDTYTQEQQIKAFNKLPTKVKRVIHSSGFEDSIRKISEKYRLKIDQASTLEERIRLVMLGLEKSEMFVSNIVSIGFKHDIAISIAKDIEEKIFQPIKKELIKITSSDYSSSDEDDEYKSYEDYKKERLEELEIYGDQTSINKFKEFTNSSALESQEAEIEKEIQEKIKNSPKNTSSQKTSKTVDLRKTNSSPRDSTPKSYTPPKPSEILLNPKEPEISQEHPEEYLTFPYKEEDSVAHESQIDLDLDEFEPKKQIPEQPKSDTPEPEEIFPTKKQTIDKNEDTENVHKPETQISETIETTTTETEEDILSQNLSQANITKKEVSQVTENKKLPALDFVRKPETQYNEKDNDPYREPIS